MIEPVIFLLGTGFIASIIALYLYSIAKEFFRLKREIEKNLNSFKEYLKQFIDYPGSEQNDNSSGKCEKKEKDDVAYMKAYV